MLVDVSQVKLYVKPGATDMRKQQAGLSVLVQNEMDFDPFNGSLYLFCNRRRNLIKILYWEKNGFCLWQKRLEQDSFPWPKTATEAREITDRELGLLLEGLDIWKAHKKLNYSEVA